MNIARASFSLHSTMYRALRRHHHRQRPGFLLMEALLGIAIFALFMFAVGLTLIAGQENTIIGGDRIRGSYLAERALEGTRQIRDSAFASVTTGAHGVRLNAAGKWVFSGSTLTMSGGYMSNVTVTSSATGLLLIAQTKWKHGYNRSGSLLIKTELTNWRTTGQTGDWSSPTVEGSDTTGGTPAFSDVIVFGNYALLTGTVVSGGNGLYIYDVSNTASPTRVNSSFNLGFDATQMAIRGKTLYVLTSDANAELKVYKLTSLPSLVYVTSYNLPGSARAASLRTFGTLLYVGATVSASVGENEFYEFDISNSGSVAYKTSFDDTGSVNDIALSGTAAYLAESDDVGELHVMNIANSGSLVIASGGIVNISGTEDGLAMMVTGTSALLGRLRGAGIQELVMFKLPVSGGAPTASGPWYHEMSGSVVGLGIDPGGCYAFAATQQKWKALQILKMKDTTLTEMGSYTLASGMGKGMYYDPVRDRIFFVSDSTFYIFKPAAATGSC